jgi:DNA-directed RNA polymerase specialized sigma24 family protein
MPSIRDMDLPTLAEHCLAERAKFRAYQESDPTYCYEIVRRALITRTSDHWKAFQDSFYLDVRRWVLQHPAATQLHARDHADDFVQDVFTRLFQTNTRHQLDFPNLAAALSFLRLCVNSVMLDGVRSRRRDISPLDQAVPIPSSDEIGSVDDQDAVEYLWHLVEKCINSPRELRLARLLWIEGYKPREIPQQFPDEFATIEEVRNMSGNIVQRLRRHYRSDPPKSVQSEQAR